MLNGHEKFVLGKTKNSGDIIVGQVKNKIQITY